MATEFIIKKGRSTALFDINGNCRIPQEKLIENGWYLTTDTAEVYVALRSAEDGLCYLRKLNDCDIDNEFADLESFDNRLTTLEQEEKVHTFGYRSGFPTEGIEGHIYVAVDEQKTYIFYNSQYSVIGEVNDGVASPDIIFGGTA